MSFRKSDQLSLCSLIAFNIGILLGRIGDKVGATKRIWQVLATFVQALFTMVAAIAIWKSGGLSIVSPGNNLAWANVCTFVGLVWNDECVL